MKNLIIYSVIILLLAVNCLAEQPVKLEGSAGKAILDSMTSTILNQTDMANQTLNQTQNQTFASNVTQNQTEDQTGGDLWSWGSLPAGFTLDESGKLVRMPTGEVEWLPGV